MPVANFSEWRKLPVSLSELCINTTLRCGQSFRWQRSDDDEWRCVLHGRILSLRQDDTHLHYRTYFPPGVKQSPQTSISSIAPAIKQEESSDDTEALLRSYFNLESNLAALYEQWSAADPNFKRKAPRFTGVRIMRQDAWETLIAFICSSNNNIARISQMVQKLCINYGSLIGRIDGIPYHSFPSPAALANRSVETRLRELGFGYRAKYIHRTAVIVSKERDGEAWLNSLRNSDVPAFGISAPTSGDSGTEIKEEEEEGEEESEEDLPSYRKAHESLLELQGVGPKVADCVCLMGLGWGEAVPVDTHVWQIAQRDYKFGKGKHKSLTKATYDAIGDHFRNLWGQEAGWAHSVLFTADLRSFSDRLSTTKVEVKEEETLSKLKKEANDEKETGKPKIEAAVRDETTNNSVKIETTVKAEKVEDNVKSDTDNDKDLIKKKVEIKQEISNPSIKTEATENATTISAPKLEFKDETSNDLVKTEDAEYKPKGDGSPTEQEDQVEEKKTDILIKTEAANFEMKDDEDVTTKSSVLAGIKREAPEDADVKGDIPSRPKRTRRGGRG